jgi:hypothetical protein
MVTDALIVAIWDRGKAESLVHRSDQGNQPPKRSCR